MLIIIGATARLIPHAWNAVPIATIALFSGVYLGRNYTIFVPALTMLLSDIFIGFYAWPMAISVYGSYIIIGFIGLMISKIKSTRTVIGASLAGSIIFFLITNFAVWQYSTWYPHTGAGLLNCYFMALPFFRNTLAGDLFFVTIFFGAYELIIRFGEYKKEVFKKI